MDLASSAIEYFLSELTAIRLVTEWLGISPPLHIGKINLGLETRIFGSRGVSCIDSGEK